MNRYAAAQASGVVAWLTLLFIGGLIVPRTGYQVWRLWRHGERPRSHSKSYSDAQMVSFARMAPTALVSMTFLVIAVDVDYFFGVGSLFLKLVVLVSGLIFMVVGALSIAVHYLHRPQWCIAPVLRDPEDSSARARRG